MAMRAAAFSCGGRGSRRGHADVAAEKSAEVGGRLEVVEVGDFFYREVG